MEFLLIVFFGIFVIGSMVLYSSLSWGYVCLKFWYWFILPVFTTLPHIEFWQAVGLMFFIGLFGAHSISGIKKEYKDQTVIISGFIITPWLTLLVGYFFK